MLSLTAVRAASTAVCAVRMPCAKGSCEVARSAAVRVTAEGNMRVMLCHDEAQEA